MVELVQCSPLLNGVEQTRRLQPIELDSVGGVSEAKEPTGKLGTKP